MDQSGPNDAGAPSFREMADALGLGMAFQFLTSPDGTRRRLTYVGELCREFTGLSAQAALQDPALLYEQTLPEYRPTLARAEAAALATLSRFEVEVRMRRAEGEVRWRRITATPRPIGEGWVVWDGILMDITEARLAAEKLQEQRRRLEIAVEATGLGLWEWDVRTSRVTWSERNYQLFGLDPKEPITIERYWTLVHPDDREAVREVYQETRGKADGGDFVVEHRTVYKPDGKTRWVQARGRLFKDAEGVTCVLGTTLDISDRKTTEERRTLLLGELAHRAKNGIQVMMAIVAQTARGADTVKTFQDVLMARLRAMAESQDLVTASGGRPVPLVDVVDTTLVPFDASRFDLGPELAEVTVAGDVAVALALLLHELSTNAMKYGALSSPGGRVAIRKGEAPDHQAVLHWVEEGGPGVPSDRSRGFGMRLLDVALRAQGGWVEPSFDLRGFQARICFPVVDGDARQGQASGGESGSRLSPPRAM